MNDVLRNFYSLNVVGNVPVEFLAFDRNALGLVKRANDFLIAFQAERTQENRRKKLAFAVDADVQDVLRSFIFEFDPGAAVRNNLPKKVALARCRLEKHAGTSM